MKDHHDFWEERWRRGAGTDYDLYLKSYYQRQDPIIDLFKQRNIHYVCDAACGYGAYSLMLASNGFQVEGFDIAPTSVEVTKTLLKRYHIDTSGYKVASVLDTGYTQCFDAVTAISVLDHMNVCDAKNALKELLRIVKPGGIVVISFDSLDEEDLEIPHDIAEDGSIIYTADPRKGMVFRHYTDQELKTWMADYSVVGTYTNSRGERFVAVEK